MPFKRDASIPFIGIHDDHIAIRRTWFPFTTPETGNQGLLAWLLNVDVKLLEKQSGEWQGSPIVFFHVPREAVDLEALRLRVTELQILVEIRCSHTGDCPVHNLDTRTLLLND